MTPVIYDLATDYARFGLSKWQADIILSHRFENRYDWDARVQGRPREIVLHIQDGWTVGSLEYWVGKQASSTVMIQRDGSILRVIPEANGPWTNGDVQNPLPDVADLLSWGGNPNIWTLSIEAEGTPWDSLTAAQLDSIEWQIREWMRVYPEITVKQMDRHRAINSVSRWNCPGASDSNDYYLAMEKRIGQGQPTTPYAEPLMFDFLTEAELDKAIDRTVNGVTMKACRRLWQVAKQTPRRQQAGLKSKKVGPDLRPGETFIGEFIFENRTGWWVLTRWGTRIFMGDLTESAVITDRS